jgi:2-phosphoglycerate kinase
MRNEMPGLVTLVCGASGVGKSRTALGLAARYGVPLSEADDIVTALEAMTSAEQQPQLHYWNTHPDAHTWPPERIADLHFQVVDVLRPAFAAVIADHIASRAPVVMEGDYLSAELALARPGLVRAVVLDEPDEQQLVANYQAREPDHHTQHHRASVSILIGAQLAQRARTARMPVLPARPWTNQLDRADRALHTC